MAFTHRTDQKLLTATQDVTPPPAYVHDPTFQASVFDFEEFDDDDERLSSIHLRINTPLTVKGDHNLIAVDAALSASKIAGAVVSALKQMSMDEHGIPMIDENGRPRSIKVEVRAETAIDGSKNVVGEKAVLAATFPGGPVRKKAETSRSGVGLKRQRAQSEPLDSGGKRSRSE
ncbi:hypothetical protein D0Z07_3818 [Hyphodiscus hymeniophilus]|uniref:Uncharacterized protein n=1 Tax=Hyphodiscus hymeniophilus TaxID=353542 RepID=A0A9P7AXS5_9HELO|nr:hypothetical protein D0Z07_3818 [Hyphodiscus hymeniophilus]